MRHTVSKPLATLFRDCQPIQRFLHNPMTTQNVTQVSHLLHIGTSILLKPQNVTSGYRCQLLLKQLNLPEYRALCELCWLLVSSLWKRQKRCKKQTMGFKSANILRVLMDAWDHCCWSLTIYKPESVPCTND